MAAVPVTVDVVPVGAPALAALADRVADAQAADPLAPVTVVVPRGPVGLAARRALAAGGLPGRAGVCSVRFLTPATLAGHLGAAVVASDGRRPRSRPVVQAAARAAARAASGGPWAAAADHPATVDALVGLYEELADADPAARARLRRQGPPAAALVDLVADMDGRLAPWWSPVHVAEAAAAEVRRRPGHWRAWLGAVVAWCPDDLRAADGRLLQAVGEVTSLAVLLGATGDPEADAVIPELAAAVCPGSDADLPPLPALPRHPLPPVRVRAPAADAEVLAALRWLADQWADGTPVQAMAIVHPPAAPYPRLVHDLVAGAGWPVDAPGHRALADTIAGRVLLGALRLPDEGWRRDDVLGWLACGPLVDTAGRPLPVEAWDRASRAAGVVGGLGQWHGRLAARSSALRRHAARVADAPPEHGSVPPPASAAVRADPTLVRAGAAELLAAARRSEDLAAFVARLAGRFEPAPTTWRGWSAWGSRLLADLLGVGRDDWPADERQAFDEVAAVLAALPDIDDLDPVADRRAAERALAAALAGPAPTTTRAGHGLLLGPPSLVAGTGRTVVAVVGLAEGWLPGVVEDDAVLGEGARREAGLSPSPRRRRSLVARRSLATVLAEADRVLCATSRSDPGTGREQWPSRWWEGAAGEVLDIPSVPELVAAGGTAVGPGDHRLRSLVRWQSAVGSLQGHPAVAEPGLQRRLAAARGRRAGRFGRFEGRVGTGRVPSPFTGPPHSATAFERFASCPRQYFFSHVLRVEDIDRPEAVDRISPRDRGLLVHAVLERFLAGDVQGTARPRDPQQPWDDHDRARLLGILHELAAELQAAGRTGWPVLWALDEADIARNLLAVLDHDDAWRAEAGAVPVAVEHRFGDEQPVQIGAPDGRAIRFHGSIDRVDRTRGGAAVVDYKTGKADAYRRLGPDDPVDGGRRLQLPVYALAARQLVGDVPVEASYWFVDGSGGVTRIGYPVDDAVVAAFGHAVATLATAIEGGRFPGRPGEPSQVGFATCRSCDYDAACPPTRDTTWAAVRRHPDLADLVALVEPEDVP